LEKPISAECAALHVLSDNENRTASEIAFKTTELAIIEYEIFKFVHTRFTFGTGNGYEDGGIFFIRFGVPDYWVDGAYYAPNPKILSSKLWV
jgi:hypothetical protein